MRKIVIKILLSICLFINTGKIHAQLLPSLQKSFNNYQKQIFKEKVFAQTDKDFYFTGEVIWFKIYNTNAETNKPSTISKIAYVEVLDFQNNPVLQGKIKLIDGLGNGSFDIPLTAKSGRFKFRVYTSLMQNDGATTFFEKPIEIYSPQHIPEKQINSSNTVDLQFFPEGGNLVEGLTSKVGFRAIDADGKSVYLKGVVVNDQNDTVARFQTLKFGNGQFRFTPINGRTYKAIAISENKEMLIKELPNVKKQGFVMGLETIRGGKLNVKIQTSIPDQKVYMFIHQGKKPSIAMERLFENRIASFDFEEKSLPDGVSYITIFNDQGIAICERLYFKLPTKILKISAEPDLLKYNTRQKVTIKVGSASSDNLFMPANLSVSIRRLDSLQLLDQEDIISYLWLSSELKGNLESPGYYLNNRTSEGLDALENLLLTQGWRKFNWDDVLTNKKITFKFLPEYNGHIIKGILKEANGELKPNTLVYMGIPGDRLQFYTSRTDVNGGFLFNTKDLYGVNELIVQTNLREDSTSKVFIQSPFSEEYTNLTGSSHRLTKNFVEQLEQSNLESQVTQNFSSKKLNQFYLPKVDTTDFFQTSYKSYKIKEYTTFNTLEEVIREYVRETLVSKKNNNFHLTVIGETKYLNNDPLVLIDGVPRFDFDKLLPVNPNSIEKLEVIRSRYYYGSLVAEGILKFTTYQKKLQTIPLDANAVVIDYEGVQLQREFYSPKYENIDQRNSRIPDFRNLLYWLPNLNTSSKSGEEFSFYTSDKTGTYIGVIQGLTNEGLAGSKTFTFEVKK